MSRDEVGSGLTIEVYCCSPLAAFCFDPILALSRAYISSSSTAELHEGMNIVRISACKTCKFMG